MEKNVGKTDQIIRIILGLIFLVLATLTFLYPKLGIIGGQIVSIIIYLLFAAIGLITGLLRTCGIYLLLGISTNK